jgi:outer membrane protein assembly factor BamB
MASRHLQATLLALILSVVVSVAGVRAEGWPAWRGPYSNGSAAPCGEALVDDPAKAKLVWESEDTIPGARVADSRRVVPAHEGQMSGGFASPVVADGRVFITYYVPNGDVYDEAITKRHEAAGGFGKEKWYVDTDDILHAFDAATGKTLWKTVFPNKGMNYNLFNKGGPCNLTPCAWDGKVFVIGSAGSVYCVDAKTGNLLWQSTVGERAERFEALRKVCHEQKRIPQFNRDMSSSPIVADGVLVCSDFLGYKVQQPVRE